MLPGVAAAALVVGYAWMATGLRPFTLPALVATLGGGLVAVIAARRLAPPVARREATRRLWWWAALGGAAALWELEAFLQHPRSEHPTFSSLTNDLLRGHVPRAGAMLVWLAAGVWLARRRTATLGQALSQATKARAAQFLLLAAWLWVGWHIFVRRS